MPLGSTYLFIPFSTFIAYIADAIHARSARKKTDFLVVSSGRGHFKENIEGEMFNTCCNHNLHTSLFEICFAFSNDTKVISKSDIYPDGTCQQ